MNILSLDNGNDLYRLADSRRGIIVVSEYWGDLFEKTIGNHFIIAASFWFLRENFGF